MATKPIRVFWSDLTERFYASSSYKIEVVDGKELATITGAKFDVTQDIARAVVHNEIEFTAKD